jgi:hypothetical protein
MATENEAVMVTVTGLKPGQSITLTMAGSAEAPATQPHTWQRMAEDKGIWIGPSGHASRTPPEPPPYDEESTFASPMTDTATAFSPWGAPAPEAFKGSEQKHRAQEEELDYDPDVTAQMNFPPYLENNDLKRAREIIDCIQLVPEFVQEGGVVFAGLVHHIQSELDQPEEEDGPRGEDYEPKRPVVFKQVMQDHSREVYQFIRACKGLTRAVMQASSDPTDRKGARIVAEKIAAISAALGGVLHTYLEYPWKV